MKTLFPLSPIARHLSALFVVAVPLTCLAADESIELSQVVVTASRTEQDIRTVPSALSVITRERIEASSATTVDQLLQGVPGV